MSDSPLSLISTADLGERLRLAREATNMTQKQAADAVSVARTTLVAIEQGQRRLRIEELQQFAKLYRVSVNAILRRESVHVDLIPRFRKLVDAKDFSAVAATELLASLARAEVELENLLGVKRARSYPPERPILPGDVRAQAEQDALELRQRLGLGFAPIADIVTLLEMELGIRVYVRRFEGSVSGVFVYDDTLGACILLNANHPRERRNQTGGHELGHFISVRHEAEILHTDEPENSREERYANAFGRCFLTPAGAVRQKFQEVTAGSTHLTRRHIIVMAHFFGVSREAMVRRLEELGLTKKGTWDWFIANGGISDEQVVQVLGDLLTPDRHKQEADKPTTIRLNLLAAEAYQRELLSEGQLARFFILIALSCAKCCKTSTRRKIRLMALPPSLPEQPFLLIADASVLINLNATSCAEKILKALPHRVAVVDVVVDEINGGVRKGRQDALGLAALIEASVVEVVRLGPQGLLRFENLVAGSAGETLDDGEAATIAYAEEVGARALIDERKARRLAAEHYATIPLGCTADLLACGNVERAAGIEGIAEAIYNALIRGRMQVLDQHMDWVVQTIGDERAAVCPSLPKITRQQAQARLLISSALPQGA